ncbi:hypothetical protein [Aneurinibacillus tyrosinisolvens]|uniref:hypothetical protein n=1 Tax=Aneurinibacillus tyrosinisolvens TaxID=1443435 RepID=UPI000A57EE27|nr:hypothetical protein [Aneurinibacillus tyrosinisolvens]
MDEFKNKIDFITCKENLILLKEEIKNEVIAPNLYWEKRIDLYEQVRLINERIENLEQK